MRNSYQVLQPVEQGSQQVDSTGSPMIVDEIDKAEIPPPETRRDGDDEHSELEENLYLVFLALSQRDKNIKENIWRMCHFAQSASHKDHILHVRDRLDTCHLPNLVMTRMTRGLERLLGPQVKAFWLHGEERRRPSGRDIDLNCVGLSAKMTQ